MVEQKQKKGWSEGLQEGEKQVQTSPEWELAPVPAQRSEAAAQRRAAAFGAT